jgi:hypothetical protein
MPVALAAGTKEFNMIFFSCVLAAEHAHNFFSLFLIRIAWIRSVPARSVQQRVRLFNFGRRSELRNFG